MKKFFHWLFAGITEESWRNYLLVAANKIEKYGWCQGSFMNDKGAYCMLGAMQFTFPNTDSGNDAFQKARQRLALRIGHNSLTVWNDKKDRTKEEVISLLKETANSIV